MKPLDSLHISIPVKRTSLPAATALRNVIIRQCTLPLRKAVSLSNLARLARKRDMQ